MPALTFSKWSSGGNTTIFLHAANAAHDVQQAWARAVLDPAILGAEQAGCVAPERRTLRMAGGEFCVNASRAFGALLSLTRTAPDGERREEEIRVSGWEGPVRLSVRGQVPHWQVSARLTLPAASGPEDHAGGRLVRLPGIAHLLLPLTDAPLPEALVARARETLAVAGLMDEAAAGVIWWRPESRGAAMFPVVHVRDAATLVAENACGSGALALALELALRHGVRQCELIQPSGSRLRVRLGAPLADGGVEAEIDGPVTLLARGRVWLDAADARN